MGLLYLLDTCVVSELNKPDPHPAVVLALRDRESECAICAVTQEELVFGGARVPSLQRRQWFSQWLDGLASRLPVLPFDASASPLAGDGASPAANHWQACAPDRR